MADISLTASMRSNLLSLQQTQSLMDTTQERLSTGKKVNSAIDNPSSYYAAQSLTNRASDLSALLDSMGQAIQTIKAADEGISTITEFASQAKAIANSARDEAVEATVEGTATVDKTLNKLDTTDKITLTITGPDGAVSTKVATMTAQSSATPVQSEIGSKIKAADTAAIASATVDAEGNLVIKANEGYKVEITKVEGTNLGTDGKVTIGKAASTPAAGTNDTAEASRKKLAAQFDSILDQIDKVANDSSYKGVNLLQGNDLKVVFNEDRTSDLIVEGKDASSAGLKIAKAADDWKTDDNIELSLTQIEAAVNTLRTMSSEFGNNYSIVQSRETFTENLINVLEEGSDKLTLADMNEESANMLALQTRQQLAINSLSLASQAAQSVLKLF